jgi:Xaa-Pro aminopeptidase
MYARHRERFLEALGHAAALIVAAPRCWRNGQTSYRYRPSSDLLYLTGWPDPNAALLLRPGSSQPVVLFVEPREPGREAWTGPRAGLEGAIDVYGADAAFPWEELAERLPLLLQGVSTLHCELGVQPEIDELLHASLRKARRRAHRNGLEVPDRLVDLGVVLHEQRVVKDADEIACLERAASVTCEAARAAMREARAGMSEARVEATLVGRVLEAGCEEAFPSIVAFGPNTSDLHHRPRPDVPLGQGDLVLIDVGAEFLGYGADLSRCFPAGGRFDAAQRELYLCVLRAWREMVDAARPGSSLDALQERAVVTLTRGLLELGLLDGSLGRALATEAWRTYLVHPACHYLGLDTHDVGRTHREGQARHLEAGMTLAVEPALYVPSDAPVARFRGLGVRLEDDLLVTDTGCRVLTEACPREIEDIEAWRGVGA